MKNYKKCSSCYKILPLSCFYKRKDRNIGIQSICKTCDKERCSNWRTANHDKLREYNKIYRREYKKRRKLADPKYHLDEIMGNAIYIACKRNKLGKKWRDLVNYNSQALKEHLENKFEFWMNWDNYGRYSKYKRTWQIDHIKPKIRFKYKCPNDIEFKKCWSLNNLRPLESIKNLKRRKKI